MDVDVAVLGGGPGGYTAAIRAAQLGAKVVCIEKEPELGGTCLRVGCIPTKAWVQTAFALREAEESFAKFGVQVGEARLDFGASNAWKAGVVKQMTQGVASLFKANGVEWVNGVGRFKDANTIAVEGGEDVTFKQAIVATGSFPLRPPIEGLDSPRCVDSTGLLAQESVPGRLVILGGGIIGCEFASIFSRFGSEVTIIEMLDSLIPQEDADAAKELAKQFGRRGIALQLGKQCHKVEDDGSQLTVHFGDGETVQADLMLVSVGRGPTVEGIGLEEAGVQYDRRAGIAADEHRRTSVPHIYAVGDCAGYWQLAHTAFREGEVAAENACGHDAIVDNRAVPRPIYTDPEIAAVGLTEAQAREQYGDDVAVGQFPWVANARAVMQDETVGWVKSIHETKYGELLGLVMVGPHVTDMVEAGVVAIDAESTVETVADGMAPHPTLSEAIKEAGLVALGRAIHLPNRKPKAAAPA
ncbi:MAG: dihydrolipoyl dehydrogenase [Actinobacteria bacterium]|nr:dihydrolipoyl dehydrogenase [Actinomycetota bacterium]